jgi:hypothetical protein
MEQELANRTRWSHTPVCSCTGGGKPVLLEGVMVICRNPSCRVHVTTLSFTHTPLNAEALMGDWGKRERIAS